MINPREETLLSFPSHNEVVIANRPLVWLRERTFWTLFEEAVSILKELLNQAFHTENNHINIIIYGYLKMVSK
jgi:hypothetical protein